MTRSILREIIILRKFSEIKENVFTSKIYEIIFPEDAVTWTSPKDLKSMPNSEVENPQINFSLLNHLFIVMELGEVDLK